MTNEKIKEEKKHRGEERIEKGELGGPHKFGC